MPSFAEFDFGRYDPQSIGGGRKLQDVQLTPEVERDAESRVKELSGNPEKVAELAFLMHMEIFDILRGEMKRDEIRDGEEIEEPTREQKYEKAFGTLFLKKSFQMKIAYYKKLLERANNTLQHGLQRHEKEQRELNGNYLQYKQLWDKQSKLEKQLEEVMAELFAERGHDPDSMLVGTRQLLEEGLRALKEKIVEVKKQNPDTAAFLQYEKIKQYSEELDGGFAWTESRKRLVSQALQRAMASRPLIVLMGESGTGKTALAKALSIKLTGMPPEREVGGKDYRLRDLLGLRGMDEQGDYLKFGPLLRAMTGMESSRDKIPKNEGGVYFDDEFNTRPVEVQRQILKFVAEAKPGERITIPGTELKVTVRPKFLYLAAGNPNNARYDREETPVEAYREFSGVLDVDYLEQTKGAPELMEVAVASLMDQKTRRLRVVSKKEVMPDFVEDSNGKLVLDELPGTGGFLWRFSQAWKGILQAFANQENPLHVLNPTQPKENYYLQKFVLDLGKVRDWLHQYKVSGSDQKNGIEMYLKSKLNEEIKSHTPEDQVIVKEMMKTFGIDLDVIEPSPKEFTIMTPKEIGYLFPNIQRPTKSTAAKPPPRVPEPTVIDIDEDGDEIPVPDSSKYSVTRFIKAIETDLTAVELKNIKTMVDEYPESVEAAKEIDSSVKIKPIEEILGIILKLGIPKLKEIAKFGKPTLLVVPQSSFTQKKNAMDGKRKYQNQAETFVWADTGSPFQAVATPTKVNVSIVDGAAHMPHIPGIAPDSRFDQRKVKFKEHYHKKGMKLINAHEYAVLMQRSLRDYQQSGSTDTSKIVDFYKDGNDTITCLDDEYLTKSSHVAYGYFASGNRNVWFHAARADYALGDLRGRPSVQVMTY